MTTYIDIHRIFILSAILFLSNCSDSTVTVKENDSKKNIHFEKQTVLPAPDFNTPKPKANIEYNEYGKPIEEFQYSKHDGSVILHTKWVYDEHNNPISKVVVNNNTNQVIEEKFAYEYDKAGRKIKQIDLNPNNSTKMEHLFVYHDDDTYTDTSKVNGQIVSIQLFNDQDKIISGTNFQQKSKIDNVLDEHGNYTTRKVTYQDGPPSSFKFTNDYDSLNNLIRKATDGQTREYEYNENGDVIKETRFYNGEIAFIILFEYEYWD